MCLKCVYSCHLFAICQQEGRARISKGLLAASYFKWWWLDRQNLFSREIMYNRMEFVIFSLFHFHCDTLWATVVSSPLSRMFLNHFPFPLILSFSLFPSLLMWPRCWTLIEGGREGLPLPWYFGIQYSLLVLGFCCALGCMHFSGVAWWGSKHTHTHTQMLLIHRWHHQQHCVQWPGP